MCRLQGGCKRHGLGVLLMTSTDEGGRLQSCTPPSFIHSFPLDPFCQENSLFSFISFSHTFLSRPCSRRSPSLCAARAPQRHGCRTLRVGLPRVCVSEWKSSRKDTALARGKVYVKCHVGQTSSVSTRSPALKGMTHASNAPTCRLKNPASNHIHMLLN